jgi:hypothetical protein
VARHKGLLSTHRVYTHDEWADYLIFRNWPLQRVFVDGRSDFFGPEIGRLAQDIAQARAGWRTGLDRYGVEIVLAPPAWPLVERLRLESSWKVVEDASEAVIFQRVGRVSGNQMEWPGKILEAKANELTGSGRILLGRAPR